MLTSRAVVLAKLQAAVGTPAVPSAATDAFLVDEPDYVLDPRIIERRFARNDLSPLPHRIGRKLAMCTFSVEARGNELQNSGVIGDVCRLARLFQACGYVASAMDGTVGAGTAACISDVIPDSDNDPTTPAITVAKAGTLDAGHTRPVLYTITYTSATEATVSSNDGEADTVGVLAGTGVAIDLGNSGATVALTFTGAMVIGSVFRVLVSPKGVKLAPVTNNENVLTIEMYFDGLKHVATDCMGTFQIAAEAGDIARIEFEFTGNFVAVADASLPDPTFETTIPPQVELARLTWGSKADLVVNAFSFDQQNEVTPRQDVNSSDGYKGVRIPARNPQGGMDPEALTEADGSFWADFSASALKSFVATIGTEAGNSLCLFGPRTQTSDLKYGDRDGTRTYDMTMGFKRGTGDDDTYIYLI